MKARLQAVYFFKEFEEFNLKSLKEKKSKKVKNKNLKSSSAQVLKWVCFLLTIKRRHDVINATTLRKMIAKSYKKLFLKNRR